MELHGGETLIHTGRPHWIVFGWAVLLGLLNARFILSADLTTSRETTQSRLTLALDGRHRYITARRRSP